VSHWHRGDQYAKYGCEPHEARAEHDAMKRAFRSDDTPISCDPKWIAVPPPKGSHDLLARYRRRTRMDGVREWWDSHYRLMTWIAIVVAGLVGVLL